MPSVKFHSQYKVATGTFQNQEILMFCPCLYVLSIHHRNKEAYNYYRRQSYYWHCRHKTDTCYLYRCFKIHANTCADTTYYNYYQKHIRVYCLSVSELHLYDRVDTIFAVPIPSSEKTGKSRRNCTIMIWRIISKKFHMCNIYRFTIGSAKAIIAILLTIPQKQFLVNKVQASPLWCKVYHIPLALDYLGRQAPFNFS